MTRLANKCLPRNRKQLPASQTRCWKQWTAVGTFASYIKLWVEPCLIWAVHRLHPVGGWGKCCGRRLEGGCGLERAACNHWWQAEKGWKGLVAGTSRGIDPGLTRPKLPSSVPWQGSRHGQWSSYPCVSTFLSPKNLNCSILNFLLCFSCHVKPI